MKIHGVDIAPPKEETLVIPRGDMNIVFKMRPVLDFSDFFAMCPTPKAPVKLLPGGRKVEERENLEYKKQISEHSTLQTSWIVRKSLEATPGLTWETVKADDPSTWNNVMEELQASLRDAEAAKLVSKVWEVCGLTADRIEQATQDFLAGLLEPQKVLSSQNTEASSTLSGEPVSDSESSPQT